jgi:hypothetical protein
MEAAKGTNWSSTQEFMEYLERTPPAGLSSRVTGLRYLLVVKNDLIDSWLSAIMALALGIAMLALLTNSLTRMRRKHILDGNIYARWLIMTSLMSRGLMGVWGSNRSLAPTGTLALANRKDGKESDRVGMHWRRLVTCGSAVLVFYIGQALVTFALQNREGSVFLADLGGLKFQLLPESNERLKLRYASSDCAYIYDDVASQPFVVTVDYFTFCEKTSLDSTPNNDLRERSSSVDVSLYASYGVTGALSISVGWPNRTYTDEVSFATTTGRTSGFVNVGKADDFNLSQLVHALARTANTTSQVFGILAERHETFDDWVLEAALMILNVSRQLDSDFWTRAVMATTHKLKLVAGSGGKLINGTNGHTADKAYSAERLYIKTKSKWVPYPVLLGLLAILTLANAILLKLKPGDVVKEASGLVGEVCEGMCGFGIEHQELETREKRFWPSESAIGHIGYVDVNSRSSPGCEYEQASGVIAGAGGIRRIWPTGEKNDV